MQKKGIINWQDLVPSDFRFFGSIKETLRGKLYASDKEVKTAVIKWLKEQITKFYKAGIHALIQRRNIAIKRNGDYVEE